MNQNNTIRLNKFIAESGICSRREADRYIEKGLVLINGRKAKIGEAMLPGDKVIVNGMALEPRQEEDKIYLAVNKPVGVTCTTEQSTHGNIVDFVRHSARVFPIGRLDKDSQGLILMTNDGDIVNKILRAENAHEKEYLVTVNKPVTDSFLNAMSLGVPILGMMTRKCKVTRETPFIFRITLIQGLNRQIRRMCEHFGYEVTRLERIRIMNIGLKGLPEGDWRDLTEAELSGIFKLISASNSESTKHVAKKKPVPSTSAGKPMQPQQPGVPGKKFKSKPPRHDQKDNFHGRRRNSKRK